MSSLIVVCPECLTWVEPHADRCTECGLAVDIDAPDPGDTTLASRLGETLLELGPVRLDRAGWPGLGRLVATTEGLLFLPEFTARPNGAIEPQDDETASSAPSLLSRAWWWPQRSPPIPDSVVPAAVLTDRTSVPLLQRLFEAPGGLFVARTSVRRLLARWNHVVVERRQARNVTLRPASRGPVLGEILQQLRLLPGWRGF